MTNYTVFKTVKYGKGKVVTGWKFTSNEEVSPRHEYCYYRESSKRASPPHSISPRTGGLI